jgi:hypothetical protein
MNSRIILDTLMVIGLIKELCAFYGTRKFVIVLTKAYDDKFPEPENPDSVLTLSSSVLLRYVSSVFSFRSRD